MATESKSTSIIFRSSALYGGKGGKSFDDMASIPVDITRWPITAINVRSGSRLDNIQVVYKGQTGGSYGGSGGGASTFTIPSGQTITSINLWTGSEVDAIQFVTSGGVTSSKYGGSGGSLKTIKVEGGSLAYITGRSGSRVDALSMVFQLSSNTVRDIYTSSDTFGGNGGNAFSDALLLPDQIDTNPVQRVRVRCGSRLDSIQFEYKGKTALPAHGGNGGSSYTFELDTSTEYISQVNIRSGSEVDGIQFITSAGRTSPWYGGSGGSSHEIKGVIAGIFGRSGSRVDQLGFFLAPAPNYLFTDFTYPEGLPSMTMAALKTIEATNYSDVEQTATTDYSYSTTHDVTVTAEWGVQVGYTMTVSESLVVGDVSEEFSVSMTASTSKAVSDSETKSMTENATINVPAKSTMKGTVIVKRANGSSVKMQCKKYLILDDGTQQYLGIVNGYFTFDIMGDTTVEWSAATPVTGTGSGVTTKVV